MLIAPLCSICSSCCNYCANYAHRATKCPLRFFVLVSLGVLIIVLLVLNVLIVVHEVSCVHRAIQVHRAWCSLCELLLIVLVAYCLFDIEDQIVVMCSFSRCCNH